MMIIIIVMYIHGSVAAVAKARTAVKTITNFIFSLVRSNCNVDFHSNTVFYISFFFIVYFINLDCVHYILNAGYVN